MDIKLLAEGHTKWDRFIRNWGISFLIDDDILFDTFGKPSVLFRNMKKQNVDIFKIKHIIISHEHWDHINGLWKILKLNNNLTVYICQHTPEAIKTKIKSFGAKIQEIDGQFKIKENVFSIGEMPSNYDGIYEQALCLKTEKGLVVLTGCAHPEIVQIIEKVKQQFGYNKNIYEVIGGFHLKDSSLQEIKNVVATLKSMDIKKFAPLHCTGKTAVDLFK